MKNITAKFRISFLIVGTFFISSQAFSQCSDLYISEYIEGSSLNKCIEIFNNTGAAIDLAAGNYQIQIYANGSATPTSTFNLTGVVADGDVYVVCHGSATIGAGEIDQTSGLNFNGNDAVVLVNNGTDIDIIGQIGTDPGGGWAGSGVGTLNQTLTRKCGLTCPADADGTDAFDPSIEWDNNAQDFEDSLGAACVYAPVVPTQLTFTYDPACAVNSETFSTTICATDASENIDATYTGSITVSIATQPGGATLGGTLTEAAVAGCATFSDLTLDVDGDYTLNSTDGSLTDGVSGTISVAAECNNCIEIESILVDACNSVSGTEGENEMVNFTTNVSIDIATMTVDWPANSYLGMCQDATTATIVSDINATITGGGSVLEPPGGIIPAGAEVVLVTSTDFDPLNHDWSNLNYTVYMVFQCAGNTGGHFANANVTPGIRELIIDVGACSDTVSYDRALLPGPSDGDAVEFAPDGTPTYGNNGCEPPIFPLALNGFKLEVFNQIGNANLNWYDNGEHEVMSYEVERSGDGKSWNKIANLENIYNSYIDDSPLKAINFYRLKEIISDKFIYSNIVKYNAAADKLILGLFPNPAKDFILLDLKSQKDAESIDIKISDLFGNTVISQSKNIKKGDSQISIETNELPSGTYILSITGGNYSQEHKIFTIQ